MTRIRSLTATALLAGFFAAPVVAGTVYVNETDKIRAGTVALAKGYVAKAIALTESGLKEASRPALRAAGLNNLCVAYTLIDDPQAALPACDAAVALDAKDWRGYVNRGVVRYELGDYAGAQSDFARADTLDPGNHAIAQNLKIAAAAERSYARAR